MMKITLRLFVYHMFLLFALQANANNTEPKSAASFEWAIFPLADGKLRVNIVNSQKTNMVVLIKCGQGETIHKNYVSRKRPKAAINYDLSELKDGDYKVYIYSGNNFEIKDFHIGEIALKKQRNLTVNE